MSKSSFLKLALVFVAVLVVAGVVVALLNPFKDEIQVSQPKVNESPTPAVPPASPAPTEDGISREEVNQLIPLHPSQVIVETTPEAVVVRWPGSGEDTILYYEVYRKSSSGGDWQKLGDVKSIGENKGQYEWRDTSAKVGSTLYIYGVRAVSIYGTKSVVSESAAITSQ